MNRTPPQLVEPNYFAYYKAQDTVPEGRVGIFISHLIQPETLRFEDYYVLAQKSQQYIPWPIRNIAGADRGVVLMDAERYYEFEEFTPTRLIDHQGRDTDYDGVPYADKYLTGEVVWSPPVNRHVHGPGILPASRPQGRHAHVGGPADHQVQGLLLRAPARVSWTAGYLTRKAAASSPRTRCSGCMKSTATFPGPG